PGDQGRARRRRVPAPGGVVVAAARRLPCVPGPFAQRPGHAGADLALGDPARARSGRDPVAVVGGAMSGLPASDGEWWLATLGRHIVWARLRVREAGTADVFDADGNTLAYDSEDSARAALMDAEFVAYEGLDEDDAQARGFSLEDVRPPEADSDEALRARMFVSLAGGRAAP